MVLALAHCKERKQWKHAYKAPCYPRGLVSFHLYTKNGTALRSAKKLENMLQVFSYLVIAAALRSRLAFSSAPPAVLISRTPRTGQAGSGTGG